MTGGHFIVHVRCGNSIPPIASGKLFPWYLCLMYVYAFGEKHFCMLNANKVFVLLFVLVKTVDQAHLGCNALSRSINSIIIHKQLSNEQWLPPLYN